MQLQIKINLLLFLCVLFFLSFVCTSAYANVYFNTTIIKQNIKIILNAGVPSSQALPGYLITAPPSVCVPAVIGVLAVWIQKQNKKQQNRATIEVSSSDEELIHQSTSEFGRCTADKDRGFADAHPRQQRKNGSRHGHQECTSTPSSIAPKAILQ